MFAVETWATRRFRETGAHGLERGPGFNRVSDTSSEAEPSFSSRNPNAVGSLLFPSLSRAHGDSCGTWCSEEHRPSLLAQETQR